MACVPSSELRLLVESAYEICASPLLPIRSWKKSPSVRFAALGLVCAAALVADDRLHGSSPDRVLARDHRRAEGDGARVAVQRLREVDAPGAVGRVGASVRAVVGRSAGGIGVGARAVPRDVDAAVVAGRRPGVNVVREARRRDLDRRRPVVPLVGRVRVHQRAVAGDLRRGVVRRLLPDGVEVARLVDRERREVAAGADGVRSAEIGDRKVDAVQAARIADVRKRRAECDREAARDPDLAQAAVVVDDVDVLDRGATASRRPGRSSSRRG